MSAPLKAAVPALLMLVCHLAFAQNGSFRELVEYGFESRRYQQDSLMMVDPMGDACLIRQLDTIPPKLLSYIFKGDLPQVIAEKEKKQVNGPYKIGTTLPIATDRLLNSCMDIMRRHFPDIVPVEGEEHVWSPQAAEYLRTGFWHRLGQHSRGRQKDFPVPLLGGSKLFFCLALGWTSRFCVTGMEQDLEAWIMSRPDRSVLPHDLFEQSYVLNGGNIYLTFLTCENVLASTPQRIERDSDPIQQKLAYIRHDSREVGDNYGAWYHFFGAALYGMQRGGMKSRIVVNAESLGSFFVEGPDRQEALLNSLGANFGHAFRKMLESARWIFPLPPEAGTDYMLTGN